MRNALHCVPFESRDDEPEDDDEDLEDDATISRATTLETQQTSHRWGAGKRSAVSRARRMCALSSNFQPQTVDTPEPNTKWTQPPNVLKLEMLRTHAASSLTELSNLNNLRSNFVHNSVFLSVRARITCLTEDFQEGLVVAASSPNGLDLSIHSLSCCEENA